MNPQTTSKISYGLFVLTAEQDGRDNGCIVNTVSQVASDPLTIAVSLNKTDLTHDMIAATGKFNACIISEAASFDLFTHFGFQSGRDVDKFADFDGFTRGKNGVAIVTEGTNAYISCTVKSSQDLGSHTLFLASVDDMDVLTDVPSATYTYYHQSIKPKPKPQATTKTVWVCQICGYVYEGEELPDDFVCPLCKHPASDFKKVEQQVG